MEYLVMLKANIKRQKSSVIGVFILIFIITVFLCTVLTVKNNAVVYENEQIERVGYKDVTSWVYNVKDMNKLVGDVKNLKEVKDVDCHEVIAVNYELNDKQSDSILLVTAYNPDKYDYKGFSEDLLSLSNEKLQMNSGEVYVSASFKSLYDAKIGDELKISIDDNNNKKGYKIKGYFEDPFMGSSMMGMKSLLMSDKDYSELSSKELKKGAMLHISKNDNVDIIDLQSSINTNTSIPEYSSYTYSKDTIVGYMLILQNIFSGFLIVFAVVLLIVAMVVISHSISSSIEQDYVNMGILKAIGFTKNKLRMIQILQYMIVIISGMIIGLPVTSIVVKIVNGITVPVTGLLIPGDLPAILCIVALLSIFLILILFICIKTNKIGKITPLNAIRNGIGEVYFKSRASMKIHKKGLGFFLAIRQLISGKKQYINAAIVSMLMVFFISLGGRMSAWVGENGEGLMRAFSVTDFDFAVYLDEKADINYDDIDSIVNKNSSIKEKFDLCNTHISLNGLDFTGNIISNPDLFTILKGRTSTYDNEIVITEFVANELNLEVGDTVTISSGKNKSEYVISGINQCANDMGANISMSEEAYKKISNEKLNSGKCYLLQDSKRKQVIMDEISAKYGDSVAVMDNLWSGIAGIVDAINALQKLMYVIVMLFILVVVILTGSKILHKEQHDLGVYKSLGFNSTKLRITFALRFSVVAIIGSVCGIFLSAVATDPMAGALLKMCGISRFSSSISIFEAIIPVIIVTVLFSIFSYAEARRIKKVDLGILIVE